MTDEAGSASPAARWAESLRGLAPAAARERILGLLAVEMTAFLGMREGDAIDPARTFQDFGFDSSQAVDFKTRLEPLTGAALRTTLVFDYPTPAKLADALADVMGCNAPDPSTAKDAPANTQLVDDPVAVVGMACRFPGGADDPSAFWQMQLDGRDGIVDVPADRWDVAAIFDPVRGAPGKTCCRSGGFIAGVDRFDAAFFKISPREASQLDPQQRLLLEIAWEAIERSGHAPSSLAGSETGVFIGLRESEYFNSQTNRAPPDVSTYYATGNALSTAAGRIAFTLGLTGPAIALDTACSSSLVAIHLAVRSLRAGECRAALAGGVSLMLDPLSSIALSQANMLAPDGRCKTFSAAADGYGRGEGCGLVYLKRLSDARRDGDSVLAVILGSAVNQDGASGGLTMPNGIAQERLIRAALEDARLTPAAVGFIEAHGTGTALGDPIEINALDAVFSDSRPPGRPLLVASVKTNLGHLETAAGIAGFIRAVQVVGNGVIPGHLHCEEPSPHIAWSRMPIAIPRATVAWPGSGGPRVAGISSFGFSGTNCHIVIGESPADAAAQPVADDAGPFVAVVSAPTRDRLRTTASNLLEVVSRGPVDVGATCFTLAAGRAPQPVRAARVVRSQHDLQTFMQALASTSGSDDAACVASTPPKVAWLFTGQGSQYASMGRELHRTFEVFRDAIERCSRILRNEIPAPLTDFLWGARSDQLSATEITQPALVAFEWSLAELLASFGIEPSVMLGHSIGEFAAAARAGVFTIEDALRLAAARGRLMRQLSPEGAMVAVSAALEDVAPLVQPLRDRAAVAAMNGPRSVVVSGSLEAIDRIVLELDRRRLPNRRLDVSHAFHSPLMDPVIEPFRRELSAVSFGRATTPIVSTAAPDADASVFATPEYWLEQLRSAVRFHAAMQRVAEMGATVAVEIGPKPTLTSMAKAFLGGAHIRWISPLRTAGDDRGDVADACARLFLAGAPVDWARVARDPVRHRVALPTTPFARERFWFPPRQTLRGAAADATADLLGTEIRSVAIDANVRVFTTTVSRESPRWLADHRVFGAVVFPAAGFIELCVSAVRRTDGAGDVVLEDFNIEAPLRLAGESTIQTVVRRLESGEREVAVVSQPIGGSEPSPWTTHVRARISRSVGAGTAELTGLTDAVPCDLEAFDRELLARGLEYGPAFRSVRELATAQHASDARLELPAEAGSPAGFSAHPALVDGGLQTVVAALGLEETQPWLPISIGSIVVRGNLGSRARVRVDMDSATVHSAVRVARVAFVAGDGSGDVTLTGLKLRPAVRERFQPPATANTDLVRFTRWHEVAAVTGEAKLDGESWLVIDDASGLGTRLSTQLRERGAAVTEVAAGANLERIGSAIGEFAAIQAPRARAVILRGLDGGGFAFAAPDASRRRELCTIATLATRALARLGSDAARLIFVTRGTRAVDDVTPVVDPEGALFAGFTTVVAHEHPDLVPLHLDLDPFVEQDEAGLVLREALASDDGCQIARRAGLRFAPRLERAPKAGRDRLQRPDGPWRLQLSSYGDFDGLHLAPVPRRAPRDGEVRVTLAAAGLNFRDGLTVLGSMRPFHETLGIASAEGAPLGYEAAGVVSEVGAGCAGVAIGDRVLVSTVGCLASEVTVDRSQVFALPGALSFTDAAAIPTTYLTAVVALEELAQLKSGETVLIHAAAGGVGQAAIAVARRAGAIVLATASAAKVPLLRRQGIEHVYSSRDTTFRQRILTATGGRGVNVVLNCLAGDAIDASFRCLAPRGRFIEIGKLGIWSPEKARQVRPDVAYHVVEQAEAAAGDPALQRRRLERLLDRFARGEWAPPRVTVCDVTLAPKVLRAFAHGRSVGKVVLRLDERTGSSPGALRDVRSDGAYVITGGTGSLGLRLATWLADRGARSLVLVARREPAPEVRALIDALGARGVVVRVVVADVADRRKLITEMSALKGDVPIVGAFHLAGVVDDGMLVGLDPERFPPVLASKIDGFWNLRDALRGEPVESLVVFTSQSGLLGSAGQAPYACANTAADALASAFATAGLPATAVAFGPIGGGGMASAVADRNRARFSASGIGMLDASAAFDAMARVIGGDAANVAVLDVDWTRLRSAAPPAILPLLEVVDGAVAGERAPAGGSPAADGLGAQVLAAVGDDRRRLLHRFVGEQLGRVLGFQKPLELDPTRRFADLGVDSLLAVEFRNRLESQLRCRLATTLLFDHPDVESLLEAIERRIDQAAPATRPVAQPAEMPPAASTSIDDLAAALRAQVAAVEALLDRGSAPRSGGPA